MMDVFVLRFFYCFSPLIKTDANRYWIGVVDVIVIVVIDVDVATQKKIDGRRQCIHNVVVG